MHLFPADRVVGSVGFVEAAVDLAERGARRVFETGCEEPVCHLVVPEGGAVRAEYTIVSVAAQASLEWPWNLLRAARGVAAAMAPVAAIWVMPGWKRDEGITIYVERPDFTEETRRALPERRPDYALGSFVLRGVGPTDPCSYVCLPSNVAEYARQFAGMDDACFPPDAGELLRAQCSNARGAA